MNPYHRPSAGPGPDERPHSPPRGRRRAHPLAIVLAVLGALALTLVAVDRQQKGASAQPEATGAVPDGWSRSADGTQVTWQAPEPIPVLGAAIVVRFGDRTELPAVVAADRRSLSVRLPPGAGDLTGLRVMAAGRRLDAPPAGPARNQRRSVPAEPAALPPALPAAADPGVRGPFRTQEGEYDEAPVTIPGLPTPAEIRAVVVSPIGAPGDRPVAVFVHGNHASCYQVGSASLSDPAWPCPAGQRAVPSYRGYLDSQRLLASQGWVTVSIDVNSVNAFAFSGAYLFAADRDSGLRAAVVRAHLDRWAAWRSAAGRVGAPRIVRDSPIPDVDRTLLVGHSRGGEAVNQVAAVSASEPSLPWRVRAQVLIAPVAVGRNPAPGIPAVALLPACDGDVYDLQGQSYVDRARDRFDDPALRSAVLIDGANHNFFNSEWTPGIATDGSSASDDGGRVGDPACAPEAPGRLRAGEQRTVLAVYTAAAAQALVLGNEAVAPLLDGTAVRAPSAGDARIVTHAIGGHRRALLVPGPETDVAGEGGVTASRCATALPASATGACLPAGAGDEPRAPHFGPHLGPTGEAIDETPTPEAIHDEPTHTALAVLWTSSGGRARAALDETSLGLATSVTMRVVAPPGSSDTRFAVRLVDRTGRGVDLGRATLSGMPAGLWWAQEVRMPLDRAAMVAAGVDPARLDHLDIVAESDRGELWLLDVWTHRPGLAPALPPRFARLDVLPTTAREPGDEPGEVTVAARVTGRLDQPATVYVRITDQSMGETVAAFEMPIPVGEDRIEIPVRVRGDDVEADPAFYAVRVLAVRGIAVGESWAELTVEDDEPTPEVSFDAAASTTEGSALRWTFSVPEPSARVLGVQVRFVAPSGGRELSTGDLTPEQLEELGYDSRLDVPLSRSGISIGVSLPPGDLSVPLELAVRRDLVREGTEAVRLETVRLIYGGVLVPDSPVPGVPHGSVLTGTVADG